MTRKKGTFSTILMGCYAYLMIGCPILGFSGFLWMARHDREASVRLLIGGLVAPFILMILGAILMAISRKKPDPPDLGELVSRRWREHTGEGRPERSGKTDGPGPQGKHPVTTGIFGVCIVFSVLWIPISPILGLIGYQYMDPRIGEAAGWFTIGGIVGAFIPIILMGILIAIFHKYLDLPEIDTSVTEPPPKRKSGDGITLGKIAKFTLKAGYYAVWTLITLCVLTPNDRTSKR